MIKKFKEFIGESLQTDDSSQQELGRRDIRAHLLTIHRGSDHSAEESLKTLQLAGHTDINKIIHNVDKRLHATIRTRVQTILKQFGK